MTLVVERVVRVVGPDAQHLAGSDDLGDVVDVAVRLLGVDAVLDPDDLLHAQVLLQLLVAVRAQLLGPGLVVGHGRVAAGIEQAHVGGDDRALAVHVDGAALEDEAFGTVATAAAHLGHLEGDLLVFVPREVQAVLEAAVGVEVPMHGALVALVVDHPGGAGVAHPRVVGGHLDDGDVLVVLEHGLGVGVVRLVHAHGDGLELGDSARHVGVLLLSRLRAPGPRVGAVRPRHPDAGLRLELAGHAVAVGLRGGNALVNRLHNAHLSVLVCSTCFKRCSAALLAPRRILP